MRKHRNYRLFFLGQIVSTSGQWMQDSALPWLVLSLTHSPTLVGMLILARFGPYVLFVLVSGSVSDRFDNRRVQLVVQTSSMLVAIGLTGLVFAGAESLWPYFLFASLGGIALAFDGTSRLALTVELVRGAELPNAVALNTTIFSTGRIVGPAVGGVLIAAVGVGWCFAINAASFLAVIVALSSMRTSELLPIERSRAMTTHAAIREGLTYGFRSPPIRLIIAVTIIVSIAGLDFRVLLPVLAAETLDTSAAAYGVLFASFGTGALLGALLVAALGRAGWKMMLLATTGLGTGLLLLASTRDAAVAAGLLAVLGFCFAIWACSSQSILVLAAPARLRGRLIALHNFAWAVFSTGGALLVGLLAARGGTSLVFLLTGLTTLGVTAYALWRLRSTRDQAHAILSREQEQIEQAVISTEVLKG